MKYKIFLLFCILLISSISVLGADVAYVLRNPRNPDANFLDVLNELNLSVDFIDDNNVRQVDFSQYRILLVGDDAKKLKNSDRIPVGSMPSIVANMFHPPDWGL
ncbi:MAG: hypothetical protein AABX08_01980, partial [Nanoarchaeota archaeon]